jgi:hypothetical protein
LYSGVCEFASPTFGVRVLAIKPLRDSFKAPVDWDPNRFNLLTVDVQGTQTTGHHGNCANKPRLLLTFT